MSTYSDTLHRTAETTQHLPSLSRHPYSLMIYTAPVSISWLVHRQDTFLSLVGYFKFGQDVEGEEERKW